MEKISKISQSKEYMYFRSVVPLKNICVENSKGQSWKVFEAGPKSVQCPLVFLPPACGTADLYFRQLLDLSSCGYRVLSVESPNTYWTVTDWCIGFTLLLDSLGFDQVHLFGASLGGFLAQKFAESTHHRPRVVSLYLCNTFADTEIFDYTETASFFWMIPLVFLKRLISPSLVSRSADNDIKDAVEFVAEKSNTLRQLDLASRLTINCISCHVNKAKMQGVKYVTIMDVFDDYALKGRVREEIYEYYPKAKRANLKNGGNYPYLSRHDEVNVHLKIHLMKFEGTPQSARETNDLVGGSTTDEEEEDDLICLSDDAQNIFENETRADFENDARADSEDETRINFEKEAQANFENEAQANFEKEAQANFENEARENFENNFKEFHQKIIESARTENSENDGNQMKEHVDEETPIDTDDDENELVHDADDEEEAELIHQYCKQKKSTNQQRRK